MYATLKILVVIFAWVCWAWVAYSHQWQWLCISFIPYLALSSFGHYLEKK